MPQLFPSVKLEIPIGSGTPCILLPLRTKHDLNPPWRKGPGLQIKFFIAQIKIPRQVLPILVIYIAY